MVNKKYIPSARDIVWIDLNPTRGREQSKIRPALVVSPQSYNKKTDLALMCPITSKVKGYPFEVSVRDKKIEGVVLADHIWSLDWKARKAKYIGKIPPKAMAEVRAKVSLLIVD